MATINPNLVRSAIRIRNGSGTNWGTGFGFARPDAYDNINPGVHNADDAEAWRLWFVTCAHVVDEIENNSTEIPARVYLEMNEEDEKGGLTTFGYPVNQYWTRHQTWIERCARLGPIDSRTYTLDDAAVDVAVTTAPTHYAGFSKLDWWGFPPRVHMNKAELILGEPFERPLSEGDDVFVVGFPVGFYADVKNWPVVRQGVLAQIQPYLNGKAETFLIDGSVFGGNSGGPVITKPQAMSIKGTRQFTKNALIGMVSGYQTNPMRGENADLGIVIPLDTINGTIEMALSDSSHVSRHTGSLS